MRRLEGRIASVDTDEGSGHVRALRLDYDAVIEGDLFIDCTGFRAPRIGRTLGVDFEDWSEWLHCDSAVAVQKASVGEAVPYTRSIAHEAGWRWRIPLEHRVGNGMVYGSRHMDDAQATRQLLAAVQGETLTTPRVIKFRPGQRAQCWRGNCVAIGLSSGFLEPLESTSIHLIQRGITRLMQMFPAGGVSAADVAEYNRQTRDEIEHIRDFIILHYHATTRQDTDFWRTCREMALPATLRHRIDHFRETGRVFRVPGELFAENSWVQVLLGQGIVPRHHHPVADLMCDAELAQFLGGIRNGVDLAVRQLPPHQACLQGYCGSPEPAPA